MRLANKASYPSELPAIGPVASDIMDANYRAMHQANNPNHPFNLETDKAADFFQLDNEQTDKLRPKQKRALTYLMYQLDDEADQAETPAFIKKANDEYSERELAKIEAEKDETLKQELEQDYKEDYKEVSADDAKHFAAEADERFEKTAKEYIELAGLVVAGNFLVIDMLDERYARMIELETTQAEVQESYQGIGQVIPHA